MDARAVEALMSPGTGFVDEVERLEQLLRRPWWHQHAACRGMGPTTFFPSTGETAAPARCVCARCPVRAECLDDALATELFVSAGVRGGLTPRERRELRKARRRAA